MVALTPIQELKTRRDLLQKQQVELIEILKTKYKDAYKWMLENDISLVNLKSYSASIAAALMICVVSTQEKKLPALVPQVQVIEASNFVGKSEDEKVKLVWDHYGHVIKRAAKKYNIDPKLIFATIMIESGGNTFAVRHEPQIGDASYGLGQMLFGTARIMGFEGSPEQLYDPEVNIELIARYHKRNQDVYGGNLTPQQLTTTYNTGSPNNFALPGHIDKFNRWYKKVSDYIG